MSSPSFRFPRKSNAPDLIARLSLNVDTEEEALSKLKTYQDAVQQRPYSIIARLHLSECYEIAQYPDLGAGEAYMALLLLDEASGNGAEYEAEAIEAAIEDFQEIILDQFDVTSRDEDDQYDEKLLGTVNHFARPIMYVRPSLPQMNGYAITPVECSHLTTRRYKSLISNLAEAGDGKHAHDFLKMLKDLRYDGLNDDMASCEEHTNTVLPETTWGSVRREMYPWNNHEPDRSLPCYLETLNALLHTVAPKLEAKVVELPNLTSDRSDAPPIKQLGLFAKEDLQPGEGILSEKSILTATARLNDPFCDACAAKLPQQTVFSGLNHLTPVSCPDCGEAVFCSEECLNLATDNYHAVLCDAPIGSIARNVPAQEASHALYALLLLRVLALACQQQIHPLDLPQISCLWGDFSPRAKTLPWNFQYNIVLPLTMLEKMEVNIFTNSTIYAPWVFNTVYAKLRGTADAVQGPDGKPQIGAVHTLWCLANHSCAPNVRWAWEDEMRFFVRKGDEVVKWNDEAEEKASKGIKKGEQILGHYCDLELPVKKRREWASGALGGDCLCERCVWESENPERVREVKIARS